MSEGKDVTLLVTSSAMVSSQTQVQKIGITKKDHLHSLAGGIGSAVACVGFFTVDVLNGGSMQPFIHQITASVAGFTTVLGLICSHVGISMRNKEEAKEALFGTNNLPEDFKLKKVCRKDKTFVSSFHIRDFNEVTLGAWINPANAIPEETSTHQVNQYLSRTRGGYQVTQEVTPRADFIWDKSAGVIAEVYGLHTVKKDMKEVTS